MANEIRITRFSCGQYNITVKMDGKEAHNIVPFDQVTEEVAKLVDYLEKGIDNTK